MCRQVFKDVGFALFLACLPTLASAQIGDLDRLDQKQHRGPDRMQGEPTAWGFTVGLAAGRANVTLEPDFGAEAGGKLFGGGSAGLLYRALERKYPSGWVLDLTLLGAFGPNLTDLDQLRFLLLTGAEIGICRPGSPRGALRPSFFLGPGYSVGSLGNFWSEEAEAGRTGLVLAYGLGLEFTPASQPMSMAIGLRKISRASSESAITTWEGDPARVQTDEADLLGVIELRWRRYR